MKLFSLALVSLIFVGVSCKTDQPAVSDAQSVASSTASGRFTMLKTSQNVNINNFMAASFKTKYIGLYHYNKGPDTTDDQCITRVKEVMHRYMCAYFDESINLGISRGHAKASAVMSDVDITGQGINVPTADLAKFQKAVEATLDDQSLLVMSGSASGNNTAGNVMGVYDRKSNDIMFYGFTNCGSDN